MKQYTSVVILILSLAGCVFRSGPRDNQAFYNVSQVAEFAGVYKNEGDPNGYLSEIIWGYPSAKEVILGHQRIELIEVSTTENSLTVKAIKRGCVSYEKSYVAGRDFKIADGKIVIRRDFTSLTRGVGDVLVGPNYETAVLGLDVGKHGKYRDSTYAAGLVFLLFPVAISGTSDIRFERVEDRPHGFPTCSP